MNNPAAAVSSISGSTYRHMADHMQTLRTELDLARASQLTMLRLQLALHKSNRRAAMQALDDLLDIDAEMEGLTARLSAVPPHPTGDTELSGFIQLQKAAIATEKHALTGSDLRNDAGPIVPLSAAEAAASAEPSVQPIPSDTEAESDEGRRVPLWAYGLAAAVLIVALGCGLIAYLWPELSGVLLQSFG